jgi:ABC-2 type transport system permease protein
VKIVTVAIREYIETIKTKTFVISSFLLPLVMICVIFATEKISELSEQEKVPTRHIAVVDNTGVVYDELSRKIDEFNKKNPQRKLELERIDAGDDEQISKLRDRVNASELYAYLTIPADVLAVKTPPDDDAHSDAAATQPSAEGCEFGRKDNQMEVQATVQRMLNEAVTEVRFAHADPPIDISQVKRLQTPVTLREFDVKTGQDTSGSELIRFMTPFAFMFLLFMGTMTISQGLLTSVIEEKSSRVVEVLLSAVSPTQLMAGKILGMVAVGATLMSIWGIVGYAGAHSHGMGYLVTPYRLTFVVLYFIPGFLLFSAFLAAVGAACNSLKEAQSMAAPLTLLTIVPMMLWWNISQNPESTLSLVLSYIPPITPFVMILRLCANPEISPFEIATTLALLWAAVIATIWFAGKVFRVGVLMYGKPPSLRELVHWLRYS